MDLVLSDENFVSDIDYLSPLGKSDHSVLRSSCNFSSSNKCLGEQLNYAKGDYVGLCEHMDIDWELCLAQHNNIEDMWTAFNGHLWKALSNTYPKYPNSMTGENRHGNSTPKECTRKIIKIKHRLWNRYLDTKNVDFLRKFKTSRNDIRKITRHIHKYE